MDTFEINNPFSKKVADEEILSVLKRTVKRLRKSGVLEKKRGLKLSIALVGRRDIAKLNKQYRKKEGSTDVLSFCYDEGDSAVVGEIVLSPEVIEIYAREDKKNFEGEFEKNLVHGLLHILGFEHGEKMFSLQEDLIKI